jgi:Uma2 family endonuclease
VRALTYRRKGLQEVNDERTLLVAARPLTFNEFVEMFGEDDEVELIDGVVVQRMAARLEHETLQVWLLSLFNNYVQAKALGIVLGSRTAVRITEHRGRLPDILFVPQERRKIIREKGIYGAPDLIIEIISPQDRPADLIALEADYRSLEVPEIWFIDQKRKQVRVLWKREKGYEERVLRRGLLRSEVVTGFSLEVKWLFAKPLPQGLHILQQLLK